jgi:hypothetical protein
LSSQTPLHPPSLQRVHRYSALKLQILG